MCEEIEGFQEFSLTNCCKVTALLVNWQCSSLNLHKTAGVKLLSFASIHNYWLIAENRLPKLDIMLCYVGTLWFQEIEENRITSWEWL